jgi:hypothetical protein
MDVNVRCDAAIDAAPGTVCELYIGHDSRHSALVTDDDGRRLRQWTSPLEVTDVEFTAVTAASLSWAPGHPRATSADVKPSLSVVAVNPSVLTTAKTANLRIA